MTLKHLIAKGEMDSMIISLNDEMASKVSFSSECRCHAEKPWAR